MDKAGLLFIHVFWLLIQQGVQKNSVQLVSAANIQSGVYITYVHQQFDSLNDPCLAAKQGAARATSLAKESAFNIALADIKNAFKQDLKEHAIAFGADSNQHIIASAISNGNAISSTIPNIANPVADLHNHPNNTPPDAGDLYGLIDINKNNKRYDTRFVVTPAGTVYVLLITDCAAAGAFAVNYRRQPPAFKGGPPGFPINLVDEFREMKYKYNCTDEMAMAFLLEKYNTGIALLKADGSGVFKKINTQVSGAGNHLIFTAGNCP